MQIQGSILESAQFWIKAENDNLTICTISGCLVVNYPYENSLLKSCIGVLKKFIDKSRLKIGRQSLPYRIGPIFAKMSFDWIRTNLSDDTLRRKLKSEFFRYFDNNPGWPDIYTGWHRNLYIDWQVFIDFRAPTQLIMSGLPSF